MHRRLRDPERAIVRATIAVAARAGLDLASPYAEMLVDVGAGRTDVAVFREGQVLRSVRLPMGAFAPRALADRVSAIWKELDVDVQVEIIENGLAVTGGGADLPEVVEALRAVTRLDVRPARRAAFLGGPDRLDTQSLEAAGV